MSDIRREPVTTDVELALAQGLRDPTNGELR